MVVNEFKALKDISSIWKKHTIVKETYHNYYLPTYTLYFLRGLDLVTSLFFPSVEFYFDIFFSVIAVGHSPRHGRVEIGRFGVRRDPEDASALSEAVPEKTLRSKMHLHRLRAIPKCCRKN